MRVWDVPFRQFKLVVIAQWRKISQGKKKIFFNKNSPLLMRNTESTRKFCPEMQERKYEEINFEY